MVDLAREQLAAKDAEIERRKQATRDAWAAQHDALDKLRAAKARLELTTDARDEACEIAEAATFVIDNGLCCKCRSGIENVSHERIDTLRKAGQL